MQTELSKHACSSDVMEMLLLLQGNRRRATAAFHGHRRCFLHRLVSMLFSSSRAQGVHVDASR